LKVEGGSDEREERAQINNVSCTIFEILKSGAARAIGTAQRATRICSVPLHQRLQKIYTTKSNANNPITKAAPHEPSLPEHTQEPSPRSRHPCNTTCKNTHIMHHIPSSCDEPSTLHNNMHTAQDIRTKLHGIKKSIIPYNSGHHAPGVIMLQITHNCTLYISYYHALANSHHQHLVCDTNTTRNQI
jgi:hypothetical protein